MLLHPINIPFLTFTDASLSIWNKTIYGTSNYKDPELQLDNYLVTGSRQQHIITKKINGDILIIADDHVGMITHYFHFMEHLLGIWNFLTYKNPNNVKMILFNFVEGSPNDHTWAGTNNITLQLLMHIFPNATIGLLKDLPTNLRLEAPKIFVSSRVLSHLNPKSAYINMNGAALPYYKATRLKKLRDHLFANMQIVANPVPKHLRITYNKRSGRRQMDAALEKQLIESIEKLTNYPVNSVDFSNISFSEQLQIIANTDLLIGVHGNGLTHLAFLPDNATLLEFYSTQNTAFFRVFAQLRGLRYYGNYKQHWYGQYLQSLTSDPQIQSVTEIDLKNTLDIVKKLHREQVYNAKIWG